LFTRIKVLVPAFYALGRSRVPVIISTISVVANIALNLWLIKPFGYLGLALGTSLTAIGNFWLLFRQLQRSAGALATTDILTLGLKVLSASVVMGIVSMKSTHSCRRARTLGLALRWMLALSIGLGLVTLYGVCRLLRIDEIEIARAVAQGN
jgi:putative peptidoglycan lipid II flippase